MALVMCEAAETLADSLVLQDACPLHSGVCSPPHLMPVLLCFQNRLLHCPWWGSFSPPLYPTFSSENQ